MRITAAKRVPMDSMRKTALVAGICYLTTFVSIPTLALYGPVKDHPDWILASGGHTAVLVGGFLEVIVALAGIGTAVTLYPVVKRQNEGLALGFVTARVLEAVMIFTGFVSLLSLLTLRQDHVVRTAHLLDRDRRTSGDPSGCVGVLPRRLADRQRLPALPDHR
jgi:uncharacterized protein DUF4386